MQRDRLYVALVEDEPSFKPIQIVMAADLLAHAFDGLDDAQWIRPLVYGFPDPARRDVEWMAHHTVHELQHHLMDIDRILGQS
jgi:hypothetical protein